MHITINDKTFEEAGATGEAHAAFSILNDGTPEKYEQDTIDVEEVKE